MNTQSIRLELQTMAANSNATGMDPYDLQLFEDADHIVDLDTLVAFRQHHDDADFTHRWIAQRQRANKPIHYNALAVALSQADPGASWHNYLARAQLMLRQHFAGNRTPVL